MWSDAFCKRVPSFIFVVRRPDVVEVVFRIIDDFETLDCFDGRCQVQYLYNLVGYGILIPCSVLKVNVDDNII